MHYLGIQMDMGSLPWEGSVNKLSCPDLASGALSVKQWIEPHPSKNLEMMLPAYFKRRSPYLIAIPYLAAIVYRRRFINISRDSMSHHLLKAQAAVDALPIARFPAAKSQRVCEIISTLFHLLVTFYSQCRFLETSPRLRSIRRRPAMCLRKSVRRKRCTR
jgi:hypothetical protein